MAALLSDSIPFISTTTYTCPFHGDLIVLVALKITERNGKRGFEGYKENTAHCHCWCWVRFVDVSESLVLGD